MKTRFSKKEHLHCGQEAMTFDGHKVIIDRDDGNVVWVRHVEKGWPFPHWNFMTRKQLAPLPPVPQEYEEAPF